MKDDYAQYYTIVQQGTGLPYTVGVPLVEYHLPEGMISLELLENIISEIRFNFKFLGFCLEHDELSASTEL
jgi:hypothetical protein